MEFRHRRDAGRLLGERLAHTITEQPVVVALPRGGVPVGYEVARVLGAPLDVLTGERLSVPVDVGGRTVVLVDDGLTTGLGLLAAATVVRGLGAERVVVALPLASESRAARLGAGAGVDAVVVLDHGDFEPGEPYTEQEPVTDEEVHDLLARARAQNTGEFQTVTLRD